MESFKIRGLTFTYPQQSKPVLNDLSFSVAQGEFITLVGPSGCGKTTLLRQLKTVLAPHGVLEGEILFAGQPLAQVNQREQSSRIGFVMQNPDNQIVTDKVWHELAFGLESLGYDTPKIRGRVAEMSTFFGIETWFGKNVNELSGGQKQILNLASIMAMEPSILILDEPTSQLDPIAAADFLAVVGKINRELGTTIIMTEHRLEEVFPMSHRVLVMEAGRLIGDGSPAEVGQNLKESGHSMFLAMPTPMRIYAAVPNQQSCPITVRDGRLWLDEFAAGHTLKPVHTGEENQPDISGCSPVIELADVWFKYEKNLPEVLRGFSVKAYRGELLAILGGNGTGKSTMLSLISGVNQPYRGQVLLEGKELSRHGNLFSGLLGVLPQNPQALFVKKTVGADLLEILKNRDLPPGEKEEKISFVTRLCRLDDLLERHPYDLSNGEQQRAALAKVLLLEPRILLLDEPTKGLDAEFKPVLAEILQRLLGRGVTVIMVSHDIEFCAKYAHRCAMLFNGAIVTEGISRTFFAGHSFYTTSASRMARHLLPDAVTAEDVIAACGGNMPQLPELPLDGGYHDDNSPSHYKTAGNAPAQLPLWRKLVAWGAGAVSLAAVLAALFQPGLPGWPGSSYTSLYVVLLTALLAFGLAVSPRGDRPMEEEQVPAGKGKLSRRTVAATAMILLAIPLTIYIGVYYLGDRKYYFIALLIILEVMLPFILVTEGRKPQARELVIISVLCSLGVAGRAAFFMLPHFKPVTAIVIISGVALGGEVGFLVGAVTMFVSNIMFGQGPWTPVQMFAMGIVGYLAGVLFQKGFLRSSRISLSIFGALSAIIIYGGLMNPTLLLLFQSNPTWPMFLSMYIAGLPFDLIHAAATAFFLWFLSRPLLEKLGRVKVKYGLYE